jgi:hypothetical protein
MKTLRIGFVMGLLAGIVGCGDNAPGETVDCNVSQSAVIGHQDCGGTELDGHRCFENCGVVDFSPDAPPPASMVGCLVGQAETAALAICVASCSECQ